jgi:hypothetical protein
VDQAAALYSWLLSMLCWAYAASKPTALSYKYLVRRHIIFSASLSLLFCACPTALVSAHSLKIDGSMAAILHTTPDDNPVSGRPSKYLLFFDDASGRFALSACNCTVVIREGNKVIATQTLFSLAQTIPGGTVTFPKAGVYDLVVTGRPIKSDTFQQFTLDYPLRVAPGVNDTPQSSLPVLLWAGVGFAACLLIVLTAVWLYYRHKMQRKRKSRRRK